jgi:hypothetical protein
MNNIGPEAIKKGVLGGYEARAGACIVDHTNTQLTQSRPKQRSCRFGTLGTSCKPHD